LISSLDESKEEITQKVNEAFEEEHLLKACENIELYSGEEGSDEIKALVLQKA